MATLVGPPGMGKSRLVLGAQPAASRTTAEHDLAAGAMPLVRHRGQLLAHSPRCEGPGRHPRERHGGDCRAQAERRRRRSCRRSGGACLDRGLPPASRRPRRRRAAERRPPRRGVRGLAPVRRGRSPRPAALVLAFEDLHWADDGLLDFVEHLGRFAADRPLTIVCTARPELRDRRPGWAGVVELEPLSDEDTIELVGELMGRSEMPPDVRSDLVGRAAGNALYAEEFVRMLQERPAGEEHRAAGNRPGAHRRPARRAPPGGQGGTPRRGGRRHGVLGRSARACQRPAHRAGRAAARRAPVQGARPPAAALGGRRREPVRLLARAHPRRRLRADPARGPGRQAPGGRRVDRVARPGPGRPDRAARPPLHERARVRAALPAGDRRPRRSRAARAARRGRARALRLCVRRPRRASSARRWSSGPTDDPARPQLLFELGSRCSGRSATVATSSPRRATRSSPRGDLGRAAQADILLSRLALRPGRPRRRAGAAPPMRSSSSGAPRPLASRRRRSATSRRPRAVSGNRTARWRRSARRSHSPSRSGSTRSGPRRSTFRGHARIVAGDDDGIEDLEQAVEVAEACARPSSSAAARTSRPRSSSSAQLDRAWTVYEQGRAAAERLGDAVGLHWLAAERPYEHYWRGDWDEALAPVEAVDAGARRRLGRPCRQQHPRVDQARQRRRGGCARGRLECARVRPAGEGAAALCQGLALKARVLAEIGRHDEAAPLADEARRPGSHARRPPVLLDGRPRRGAARPGPGRRAGADGPANRVPLGVGGPSARRVRVPGRRRRVRRDRGPAGGGEDAPTRRGRAGRRRTAGTPRASSSGRVPSTRRSAPGSTRAAEARLAARTELYGSRRLAPLGLLVGIDEPDVVERAKLLEQRLRRLLAVRPFDERERRALHVVVEDLPFAEPATVLAADGGDVVPPLTRWAGRNPHPGIRHGGIVTPGTRESKSEGSAALTADN